MPTRHWPLRKGHPSIPPIPLSALAACGIEPALPDGQSDPGVITTTDARTATDAFVAAIAKHRHVARETDPPRV
jgi:hypothetical protein